MSEPLVERLSRFTPAATGLDRDALLFAAGRASVRPHRRWQMLAGMLAACQLVTLVGLWPRTPSPLPAPASLASHPATHSTPEEDSFPASPRQWTPRTALWSLDLDRPEPLSDEPMVPPEPPLYAFGPVPASILN